MSDRSDAVVREPYHTLKQQHGADTLGMFVFLASEIMLFGGLMTVILITRFQHSAEVVAASQKLHIYIGAINTAVLLSSSLSIALAVHAARAGARKPCALWLGGSALLGLTFIALKAYEYSKEYAEGLLPGFSDPGRFSGPVERLFMDMYLISTSLHALHLLIGITVVTGLAIRVRRGAPQLPQRAIVVETVGLYWHLVDVIWVFLYPFLYLAR